MTNGKSITPADEVCQILAKSEAQYKAALPSHIHPLRFIRVAQTAIRVTPKLAGCERTSLYAAFLKCAESGLLPNGQEAAIVPFGTTARFMPMVQGICKKARNSGEIKTINAKVVYENDSWQAWTDENGEHFKHTESDGDRGKPRLTYAYAITKDGGFYLEVITEKQMESIEKQSRAGDESPWKGPFKDEMKRKSAIRRLAKYRLPSSTDLDEMIRAEDDILTPAPTPATEKPAATMSSKLRDVIETTATSEPPAEEVSSEQLPI